MNVDSIKIQNATMQKNSNIDIPLVKEWKKGYPKMIFICVYNDHARVLKRYDSIEHYNQNMRNTLS